MEKWTLGTLVTIGAYLRRRHLVPPNQNDPAQPGGQEEYVIYEPNEEWLIKP